MRNIKFRAWIESQKYMAIQGTPDLETLAGFMFHYGDEKLLMQSTELFDKQGNEVFEMDYLQNNNGSFFLVKFTDGCFCLHNVANKNHYPLCKSMLENKTVISNYYEYSKRKV